MRTNFSWSFSHCRKAVILPVLYAAFFAASSSVLAQGYPETINADVSTTVTTQLSREDVTTSRVLETLGSTQTDWSFESTPKSGNAVFTLADNSSAATTRGSRATVVYTFSPPDGSIVFGARDTFVVRSSSGNVVSTVTFTVSFAADLAPTISGPAESLSIHQQQQISTFTFSAGADPGDRLENLRWSLVDSSGGEILLRRLRMVQRSQPARHQFKSALIKQ